MLVSAQTSHRHFRSTINAELATSIPAKFHAAQVVEGALTVGTMPGAVCDLPACSPLQRHLDEIAWY